MKDIDELNALGRRIRGLLRSAEAPLMPDEIARRAGASIYDVHDAISISLHGWVEIRNPQQRVQAAVGYSHTRQGV